MEFYCTSLAWFAWVCIYGFFLSYILWNTKEKSAVKKIPWWHFGSLSIWFFCLLPILLSVVGASIITHQNVHTRQPHFYTLALGWDSTWNIPKWCFCIICPNTWDYKHRCWGVEVRLVFQQLIKSFMNSPLPILLRIKCVREEGIGKITLLPRIHVDLNFCLLNLI